MALSVEIGKQDLEAYPDTISSFWICIEDMKSFYAYIPNFQPNVDKIFNEHKIMCWKKNRGDGNCYFRAVISTYFLNLCKPYSSIQLLSEFYNIVQNLSTSSVKYEYEEAKIFILNLLAKLLSLKSSGHHIRAFEQALKLTQNREFDLKLIRISRLATLREIEKAQHDSDYNLLFIDGIDFIKYDVLEMGRGGEYHSLIFLPKALGIQVIHFMFLNQPQMFVEKFPENKPQKDCIVIRIAKILVHYDTLGNLQEYELDQINLNEGSYSYALNSNGCFNYDFYSRYKTFQP